MWYEHCANPHAISTLYSPVPDLSVVELHEVRMHRDGLLLQLRFDLPVYPSRPPARWPSEASVAQAVVDFWGVSDLRIEGWAQDNVGTLTVGRQLDMGLTVVFESSESRLRCRCGQARVASVTAYAVEAA